MSDILARIIEDKKQHIAACKQKRSLADVEALAKNAPPPRNFYGALEARHEAKQTALITEIKKASPSAGVIRPDFNPEQLARIYESAGASCLSVLTDTPYFQGHDDDLKAARAACSLPVLRKDFMLEPYQIAESRALGADCVLLILACLSNDQTQELMYEASEYDLSILIEIHDEEELDRYLDFNLDTPKTMLGINNRNLKTLEIDLGTTERLAAKLGDDRLLVGESGIKTAADVQRLKKSGVHCFLVGENLLKAADVGAATKSLLG